MHRNTKVATCCYCNARTVLVLDAKHHELTCRSCGAPLHNLKMLPAEKVRDKQSTAKPSPKKQKKEKKKKSTARWFLSEAADLLDDIFD